MNSWINKTTKSEMITYCVIILWVVFGLIAIKTEADLEQVSGYYASLTLFVSTYLFGEYKRPALETSIFKSGKNSSRETVIYIVIGLWIFVGVCGMYNKKNMNSLAIYFASLSPFISSYILARTASGKKNPTIV